ncbi:5-formyltetrahydrofolate cyclo-ligase [Candidatus Bathyarchaeota archaeon]|nr:5-formyltetrahydrofolate cyclo-ligase [Candidatus Bathyarchaeota archaeon]
MEEMNIARFPRPVYGRIPNFVNSEVAARNLIDQKEFKQARVIKVNPDSPQSRIRYLTLLNGKTLIMPTPRLRNGFLILDPNKIPKSQYPKASSIHGAFKHGKPCSINNMPHIDLVVVGSVAASRDGIRIGKGGGYSEIEYGVLREIGSIKEDTPIFTTVHDVQMVDEAPRETYDLIVDAIITPTRVIRVKRMYELPKGIIWEKLSADKIREIPILVELRKDSCLK